MKIKIDKDISITNISRPLIIAEVSANHCGSKKKFIDHIVGAAKNGADLIKIQTYQPEDMTVNSLDKKFLLKKGLWKGSSLWNLYKKAQTPFDWHYDAFKVAKKYKKIIFSTPFSIRGVDFLEKLKVPIYKISSFEITDLTLIDKIAKTNKPIILSTGLATISEIKASLKIIRKYHNKIIILHCVSGYPTKENEVNLFRINQLKKIFKKNFIGLSDHTDDINTSLASIPLGVKIIEKHYKLNNKIYSEDSKFSITSDQLRNLKQLSIKYFNSLVLSKQSKSEKINKIFRRSLYTSQIIKKGDKFTHQNVIALRPNLGICASKIDYLIGKKSKKYLKKNTSIKINHINKR